MIRIFLTVFLFSSSLLAESSQDLMACSMFNGSFLQKINYSVDRGYQGIFVYPLYYQMPSEEVLEASKEAWRQWDGVSEAPEDPRRVGAAIPLESFNVMTPDLERLSEKAQFFNKLFPSQKSEEVVDGQLGILTIDFQESCDVLDQGEFMAIHCEANDKRKINGVEIERVLFTMRNQKLTSVDQNLELQSYSLVTTDLTLLSGGRYYRSSYSFTPNGNDIQCSLGASRQLK